MRILERKTAYLFLGLGVLVLFGIFSSTLLMGQSDALYVLIPLHATLEATSAIVVVLAAIFLLSEEACLSNGVFELLGMALLGIGIFDLFHSASPVGSSFVWLRSLACLIGGAGFALTWLPTSLIARRNRCLLGAIALLWILLGGVVATSNFLPQALAHDRFSGLAVEVNLFAAILFLLGSVRLFSTFHKNQEVEYYLLAWFGLLNAASGLEFPLSRPWGLTWWLWHGLLPLSAGIACFLLFWRHIALQRSLVTSLADLQRANTTIREQAEVELRCRELEFTRVANSLPGPVCRVDRNGRNLFANAAYLRWFGKRPEEAYGLPQAEILGESLYHEVRPYILRVMDGETVNFEMAIMSPAGEALHGNVSLLPDLDATGKVRGYFTLVLDVTEQKRAEAALLASQVGLLKMNRIYAVLSAVNQTIVRERNSQTIFEEACRIAVESGGFRMAWVGVLDEQSKVIHPIAHNGFSDGYVEQLAIIVNDSPQGQGPTASSLRTGLHTVANDIVNDPTMAPWRQAALERGYQSSASFPIKVSGKVTVNLNLYAAEKDFFDAMELRLLDEMAGDIGYALEFIELEKSRQASEEALQQSAIAWQTTFSAMNDAICLMDQDHVVVKANQAMVELCQKPLTEIIGQRCWSVVHNTDRSFPVCPLPEIMQTKSRSSMELILADRTYEVIVDPVLDQNDSIVGIVHIMRDITEQKALSKQLQQAQRLESVGRLAGGVAHDFNNMLGVIVGYTEMAMAKVEEDAPFYEDLEEIYKAAQRAVGITRQLLTFARKQIVSPQILDLNVTVEAMLNMLRRLIGEDIRLVWQPGPNLWRVKVDPSQVDQLLANLSVNARDAIQGNGVLTIETRNVSIDASYCLSNPDCQPGDYCLISVGDTGAGMDKDTLAKIFEPFFTTKEVGKGTGLGLATVYGVVKQNKGFVNVSSEPGQGTTVNVYLPRITGEACPQTPAAIPQVSARGNETVLFVEDEKANLLLGQRLLTKYGYTVLAANCPSEALALIANHPEPIDLLITDVVMPEMNGKELMQKIRSLRPTIKVLFTSGYTAEVIARQGVLEKDVNFIQKPFPLQEFMTKVRAVLYQGGQDKVSAGQSADYS